MYQVFRFLFNDSKVTLTTGRFYFSHRSKSALSVLWSHEPHVKLVGTDHFNTFLIHKRPCNILLQNKLVKRKTNISWGGEGSPLLKTWLMTVLTGEGRSRDTFTPRVFPVPAPHPTGRCKSSSWLCQLTSFFIKKAPKPNPPPEVMYTLFQLTSIFISILILLKTSYWFKLKFIAFNGCC